MEPEVELVIIGGGPAGLRAAEVAAGAGVRVVLFDGMRSVGRKFLVAGKGGLNLTHGESLEDFAARYDGFEQPPGCWEDLLAEFGPRELREWAHGLGVETFQAGTGRVYPKSLKGAPLLRRWIARLKDMGVRFEMNRRWTGLTPGPPHRLEFHDGSGISAAAVVFALGGASWPQTGSDGSWLPVFQSLEVRCRPLLPANCGWEHPWPEEVRAVAEGQPLKNITVTADGVTVSGELLVTRHGLEGGAIYQLGPVLRVMPCPEIVIDFKPTFTKDQLVAKMESVRRGFLEETAVRWKLPAAARAILGSGPWSGAVDLAEAVKHCVIPLTGPRPVAEAISSAGGVCWSELDRSLMLHRLPGVFVSGEMIDWEAPTGGYLLQGCFATGTRVGCGAVEWLRG